MEQKAKFQQGDRRLSACPSTTRARAAHPALPVLIKSPRCHQCGAGRGQELVSQVLRFRRAQASQDTF